jgi:cytochrome subunit of sulfide dehydrogenase
MRQMCFHVVVRAMTAAGVMLVTAGVASAADIPAGAAACSGCHPAGRGVDTPVPRLIGRDAAQIVAAMADFRAGKRPATIMDRVAKGFTEDETKAIAAWFAAQKD